MKPGEPTPVKFVMAILYSDNVLLETAAGLLLQHFGPIDYKSPAQPFDITDYYVPEMGQPIFRCFFSFTKLINPGTLAEIKINCNTLEDQLAVDGKRKINLDPGYMDYDKYVLASAKYNAHKIYLDKGIYADLTLRYRKGQFIPSAWCFPDFRSGAYDAIFLHIRAKYKGQLRKNLAGK
ncbi:DUF4416 family protein [candidate division KSB1 bacterium]|nr:DUF4416 family protein [candidate division KSB1 bacterium]